MRQIWRGCIPVQITKQARREAGQIPLIQQKFIMTTMFLCIFLYWQIKIRWWNTALLENDGSLPMFLKAVSSWVLILKYWFSKFQLQFLYHGMENSRVSSLAVICPFPPSHPTPPKQKKKKKKEKRSGCRGAKMSTHHCILSKDYALWAWEALIM